MTVRRTPRPGEQPRVPFEQAIALRFKYFGDFIEELSANISMGGMFIRTRNPHPIGSVFEFELRLGDDFSLIEGKAQVVWARRQSEGEPRPAGMGVRFVEIDDHSRRVIQRMVREHLKRGGASFELPDEAPPVPAATETLGGSPPKPAARAATADEPAERRTAPEGGKTARVEPEDADTAIDARSRDRTGRVAVATPGARWWRRRWSVVLPWTLAAAAVLLLILVLLRPEPAQQAAGSTPLPAPPPPEPAATAPATAAPIPATGAETGPPAEATADDAVQALRGWAQAWSEQRVDDYLASYSEVFQPPDRLGRRAWERRRRARILAPEWIRIGMAFVEAEATGTDRVRVRFVQAYDSDAYRDVVRKRMELQLEDGAWRILSESVEG